MESKSAAKAACAAASASSPADCEIFEPAVKASAFVLTKLGDDSYRKKYEDLLENIRELRKTRLHEIYSAEYNSFRGCKARSKERHQKFDTKLKDFRDFLAHLGPRPSEEWSVDRINTYKGYVVGNVRWATKREQTKNRKVTKFHSVDGKQVTTAVLADMIGIPYSTLYKRLRRGWTLNRILQDRKSELTLKNWKFPPEVADLLEPKYQARTAYGQQRIHWFINYLEKIITSTCSEKEFESMSPLIDMLDNARSDLSALLKKERERAKSEIEELLARCAPPKVDGFSY